MAEAGTGGEVDRRDRAMSRFAPRSKNAGRASDGRMGEDQPAQGAEFALPSEGEARPQDDYLADMYEDADPHQSAGPGPVADPSPAAGLGPVAGLGPGSAAGLPAGEAAPEAGPPMASGPSAHAMSPSPAVQWPGQVGKSARPGTDRGDTDDSSAWAVLVPIFLLIFLLLALLLPFLIFAF
ncbi:MAG: hypothetical protein Q3979_09950 [Actinomycetaceae bacterium]|nr:hypothetical protein [Actinomycetaceae bacterium]